MFDEERPDEPDHPYPEPDPEADLDDPAEELGPEPPTPEEPSPPDFSDAASEELLRSYWQLVVATNAALFGLAVGPMALVFYPDPRLGGALLAVGFVAVVLGARRYREVAEEA